MAHESMKITRETIMRRTDNAAHFAQLFVLCNSELSLCSLLYLIESGCRIRKMRPMASRAPFQRIFPNKMVAGSVNDLLHANQFGADHERNGHARTKLRPKPPNFLLGTEPLDGVRDDSTWSLS
jgi:hypothetical protein